MSSPPGPRLLMTADAVGGVWIFAATLARALVAGGFRVHMVTLGPKPSASQRSMISGFPGLSLTQTDLALEWQDPAGGDLARAKATLQEVAEWFAPDLVHINSFREASFDWGVPTVLVAHSCVNSWASACDDSQSFAGQEWRVYSSNVRAGLCDADAWVAPTAAFADQLTRQYELPAAGKIIWNGISNFGTPSGSKLPVILAAGRVWDKAKNLSVLSVAGSSLDWPIRIAGPSEMNGTRVSLAGGCELLGELPRGELLREMRAASIFVSPALYEPFGLSVLEAASAGCALLLSEIPTFRELWEDSALFVEPGDAKALTAGLRLLSSDQVKRSGLQRAALERSRRYALRATANAYRSLYTSLLPANAGITAKSAEMLA